MPDSTDPIDRMKLWDTPVYRFRVPPNPFGEETDDLVEIVFNVTGSAPSIKEPSEELKLTLDDIFSSDDISKINSVVEIGAAKLKNIPYILSKGKSVCAVDFEELVRNPITRDNIEACEKFGRKFKKMIFPNPFIGDDTHYDLALLLNVLPVMPVFAERLYMLDLLHDKVKNNKYVLWLAQKEGSYKKDRESGKYYCGDGIWMGKRRKYKTFYKYHAREDVDEMMALFGFELLKSWAKSSDIRLYKKIKYNLFRGLLNEKRILQSIPRDNSILNPKDIKPKLAKLAPSSKPCVPNPEDLTIESLYIEKIESIPEGPEYAEEYHRVVSLAIARIFRGSLRNMTIKVPIGDSIKVIDTLYTNCAKEGFFNNLRDDFKCTHPILEVKNYTDDIKNPEVDQLNGRLNQYRGQFGMIACRHIDDENGVYKRCATALPDRAVLFLTDNDIFRLLDLSRSGEPEEISDFMDNKLQTLLFKKG
jgi:hypothetical protein